MSGGVASFEPMHMMAGVGVVQPFEQWQPAQQSAIYMPTPTRPMRNVMSAELHVPAYPPSPIKRSRDEEDFHASDRTDEETDEDEEISARSSPAVGKRTVLPHTLYINSERVLQRDVQFYLATSGRRKAFPNILAVPPTPAPSLCPSPASSRPPSPFS